MFCKKITFTLAKLRNARLKLIGYVIATGNRGLDVNLPSGSAQNAELHSIQLSKK